jgi:hypothetical protein
MLGTTVDHYRHSHYNHDQQLDWSDNYDEFGCRPQSPPMKRMKLKIEPDPSPPPEPSPANDISFDNRPPTRPCGQEPLIAALANNRLAVINDLAVHGSIHDGDPNGGFDELDDGKCVSSSNPRGSGKASLPAGSTPSKAAAPPSPMRPGNLRDVATDALQLHEMQNTSDTRLTKHETEDISKSTGQLSLQDEAPPQSRSLPPIQVPTVPRYEREMAAERRRASLMLTPPDCPLPPITPSSDANGQTLPPIRETLSDMELSSGVNDNISRPTPGPSFHRPHPVVPRLPILPIGSPSPVSPSDSGQRVSLPSPRSLPASSPGNTFGNRGPKSQNVKYMGSNEGPNTESSSTTSPSLPNHNTPAASADRMSIDGITNQPVAAYLCTFKGCKAPPFSTLYLLNSHANVHSSARPHYCPVPGCARGESGKGFKRKNEMIRHGLVHDSPGYICPFCPDRDHRYPRPDNLQRCV